MATRGKKSRKKMRVVFARLEQFHRGDSRRVLLHLQRRNGSVQTITYRKAAHSTQWYVDFVRQVQAFTRVTVHKVGQRDYLRNRGGGGSRGNGSGPNHYHYCHETPIWQTTKPESHRVWLSESEVRTELARYGKSLD